MASFLTIIGIFTISLIFLFVGLTVGYVVSKRSRLAVVGLGLFLGSFLWLGSLLFPSLLLSIPFFADYAQTLDSVIGSPVVLGSQTLTGVFSLIVVLEIGYVVGFGSGKSSRDAALLGVHESKKVADSTSAKHVPQPVPIFADQESVEMQGIQRVQTERSGDSRAEASRQTVALISRSVNPKQLPPNLSEDEKTLASLFVLGKVREVTPKLDDGNSWGYYYEQLHFLEWEVAREAKALNSLTLRGYLSATPREKVMRCKQCGSMRLQLRSECPECGAPRIQRHKVLEHFPCGMIDKEESFKQSSGQYLCPKCHKTLDLIGLDYRSLGSMFVCQDCGALSKDLSTMVKCTKCGHTTSPEEEVEDYLFSYVLNQAMTPKLRQYVKPVQTISNYFENLGLTIFSPALVRGRSGTDHGFDLLIVEKVKNNLTEYQQKNVDPASRSFNRKMVVELLISDSPIRLDEITKVFGKINDVAYQAAVVAIPSLSEGARNYATTYNLKVVEAESVDAALAKLEALLGVKRTPEEPVTPN